MEPATTPRVRSVVLTLIPPLLGIFKHLTHWYITIVGNDILSLIVKPGSPQPQVFISLFPVHVLATAVSLE